MKKSLENYNNIKIAKRNLTASSEAGNYKTKASSNTDLLLIDSNSSSTITSSTSLPKLDLHNTNGSVNVAAATKRPVIFKSKAARAILENKLTSTTSLPSIKDNKDENKTCKSSSTKFNLKRALNKSLDDDDIFDDFDNNDKTISIMNQQNGNHEGSGGKKSKLVNSSSTTSANSLNNSSNKSTDNENNSTFEDTYTNDQHISSTSQCLPKEDDKKAKLVKSKTDEPISASKEIKNAVKTFSFNDLDDDDDDDDLFGNHLKAKKQFKLVMSSSNSNMNSESAKKDACLPSSVSTSSTASCSSTKPVKRKIFSSSRSIEIKAQQSAFKLNFNDNDVDDDNSCDSFMSDMSSSTSSTRNRNGEAKLSSIKENANLTSKEKIQYDEIISLRNTRKAYECEELGETQAFLDDLFFLMDGLNAKYKLSERCLCAIKLAEQCLSSEFRMSLRSSPDSLNKIFKLLSDAAKYKSLALCTSLIMFALTQDKLVIEIDRLTFHLITSILNLNQISSDGLQNGASSISSKTRNLNSKNVKNDVKSNASREASPGDANAAEPEDENNDENIYKRIFERCKKLFQQLNNNSNFNNSDSSIGNLNSSSDFSSDLPSTSFSSSTSSSHEESDAEPFDLFINSQTLALECILNLNLIKKHNETMNDWYKNELREQKVLDKLISILKLLITSYKSSFSTPNKSKNYYLISKYAKYISLLETCTYQPFASSALSPSKSAVTSASQSLQSSPRSNAYKGSNTNLSIEFAEYTDGFNYNYEKITISTSLLPSNSKIDLTQETKLSTQATLNQNYLVDYNKSFLIDLIKESLTLFFNDLEILNKDSASQTTQSSKKTLINAIKQTFFVMINLTLNNENTSRKLAKDESLIDLLFKYIHKVEKIISENEQFDILVTAFGTLLNIFDSNFMKEGSLSLIKNVKSLGCSSFDIFVNLYKTKEAVASLAETDYDNQFRQLNQDFESQNAENIQLTLTNSLNKAGKHAEDHIIAAQSAILIGYMLLTNQHFNNPKSSKIIDTNKIVSEDLCKRMIQIINKFLEFMKIMKCAGCASDEHVKQILGYLEQL